MKSRQQTEITVLSEILRYLREEGHEDKDDYASSLPKKMTTQKKTTG